MLRIDVLKKFYNSLNHNDISDVLSALDPEIKRVEWEGYPTAGKFEGLKEMEAHLIRGRSTWAEGGCYPEEFIEVREKIIVLVHVKVRLKDKQDWIDGHTADVFSFRDGKITEMYSFFEKQQAIEWANK